MNLVGQPVKEGEVYRHQGGMLVMAERDDDARYFYGYTCHRDGYQGPWVSDKISRPLVIAKSRITDKVWPEQELSGPDE